MLTFSRSKSSLRIKRSATTENASLISHTSISSLVSPAFSKTFSAAGTGAFSISVGQSPMLAVARIRARGVMPLFSM